MAGRDKYIAKTDIHSTNIDRQTDTINRYTYTAKRPSFTSVLYSIVLPRSLLHALNHAVVATVQSLFLIHQLVDISVTFQRSTNSSVIHDSTEVFDSDVVRSALREGGREGGREGAREGESSVWKVW